MVPSKVEALVVKLEVMKVEYLVNYLAWKMAETSVLEVVEKKVVV